MLKNFHWLVKISYLKIDIFKKGNLDSYTILESLLFFNYNTFRILYLTIYNNIYIFD